MTKKEIQNRIRRLRRKAGKEGRTVSVQGNIIYITEPYGNVVESSGDVLDILREWEVV